MIGLTKKRDERIRKLEAENKTLAARVKELEKADFRKQALASDKARLDQMEHTKRFEAKAGVSKEVIREMREAIKVAIVSIRDLAGRRPNTVTAEHLTELAHQADNLVRFTSLPR